MEIIVVVTLVAGVLWFLFQHFRKQQQQKQELLITQAYQAAMASGDKEQARTCGRAFYSFFRKGELTLYDEQAIIRDLSSMK
ncbi:hypothetical protein [Spirosoma sp. KNUC1025]|uniref:hypothetical protein n=1 Tax=Spirosoma sp. KNUC1025 TaxID=2894082 RepID=UPI00386F8D71|nr:hypothetical protein LN737_19615 [Spirosoma sp. KNUC1025]